MKIGITGAPGSGKSDFAYALSESLNLRIVDDYVPELEAATGYVYGKHATYVGNIHIGLARHHTERNAGDGFITCGTMLDTVTHMALKAHASPDEADMRRLTGGLVVLGCMVEDMMDYDHLFWLPSDPKDDYAASVAQGIEEALDIFGAKYCILDHPSVEERVDIALLHVNAKDGDEAPAPE